MQRQCVLGGVNKKQCEQEYGDWLIKMRASRRPFTPKLRRNCLLVACHPDPSPLSRSPCRQHCCFRLNLASLWKNTLAPWQTGSLCVFIVPVLNGWKIPAGMARVAGGRRLAGSRCSRPVVLALRGPAAPCPSCSSLSDKAAFTGAQGRHAVLGEGGRSSLWVSRASQHPRKLAPSPLFIDEETEA